MYWVRQSIIRPPSYVFLRSPSFHGSSGTTVAIYTTIPFRLAICGANQYWIKGCETIDHPSIASWLALLLLLPTLASACLQEGESSSVLHRVPVIWEFICVSLEYSLLKWEARWIEGWTSEVCRMTPSRIFQWVENSNASIPPSSEWSGKEGDFLLTAKVWSMCSPSNMPYHIRYSSRPAQEINIPFGLKDIYFVTFLMTSRKRKDSVTYSPV